MRKKKKLKMPKRSVVERYVDTQLKTMRRYGAVGNLSRAERRKIVDKIRVAWVTP